MQADRRFARCSLVTITISALAAGVGALSATLGAPPAAIVPGEMCGLACVVAFTLLIWAAIQDGKQPERAAAE
jgi:hypothetical protein